MKNTHPLLISLAAAIAVTCTAVAGTKISVPVQAYELKNNANPPAYFEVNATAARDSETDRYSKSWVWFGGKITNKTGADARYKLSISFYDAKGNDLGGTTFTGVVKARDYINLPEKDTVMDATAVKQIYTAKYLLVIK